MYCTLSLLDGLSNVDCHVACSRIRGETVLFPSSLAFGRPQMRDVPLEAPALVQSITRTQNFEARH